MPMSKKTTKEIHLFIIWEHARHIEEKILADIADKFHVLKTYEVHWTKSKFSENLSRFYGTNLPPNSKKEAHVGNNPFLAIVVEDQNPVYRTHTTSKGNKHVNTNLFTSKATHRDWTGGGHKIHATNTRIEADHDLTLLFGKNTSDFLKDLVKDKPSAKIEKWPHDVVGSNGWENLKQLFYVLNNTIDYVVLRNFDQLPDEFYAEKHGDIDLLVPSYEDISHITNAKPVFKQKYRVYNNVVVSGKNVLFDFRNIGDGYYDNAWQTDILSRRKLNDRNFYVPSDGDHFYSLLYHALVQKPQISSDYIGKLISLGKNVGVKLSGSSFTTNEAVKVLATFLKTHGYIFSQPVDNSVYLHQENVKVGVNEGVPFAKVRRTPLRNYLKKHKVLLKHYVAKTKRIARGYFKKIDV